MYSRDLYRLYALLWIGALILGSTSASAQVVNPADKAREQQEADQTKDEGTQNPSETGERLRTWEMPPITVYGRADLRDDDRVGAYAQPRWTTHRSFGETRVYVIPKGVVDFEYWFKPEVHRHGEPTQFTHQFEIEFGLPYRFQLDLYAVANQMGPKGEYKFDEQKVELRWALANWGKIPGNPAFYIEWNPVSGAPPHVEGKLLLGGQAGSGWHWGSNIVYEHEAGGLQENSKEWTVGLARVIRDTKFTVGAESKLAFVSSKDLNSVRGPSDKEWGVGPSFQIRPLPPMHLDVAWLFGATNAAPSAAVFVVLGWEF